MAIGYGVPAPKPEPITRTKARKQRADVQGLNAFRDAVWWANQGRWTGRASHESPHLCVRGLCEVCGCAVHRIPGAIPTGEVHHIIGRRAKATRYDPANGILLCRACHQKETEHR